MNTLTFKEQHELNKPLRIQSCKAHYNTPPNKKFETFEQAKATKGKFGNWICLVKMEDGTEFYTCATFSQKWVYVGMNLGMWNELHLVEKFKR